MRQVTVTADNTGATAPVILDQYISPFSVTYGATGTGAVEVSLTDPYSGDAFVWATAPTAAPNAVGFLGQPYRAVRLSGGAQGDTLTVIQAGIK